MTIHLIRHGKTRANESWLYCGWTDLPLSENGRKELEGLRKTVAYPDISGCRIYTSGMERTRQTLEVLYGAMPYTEEPCLKEMNFGEFEMRDYEHLKDDPDYQRWITGDNMANVCPKGESGNAMTARVLFAFSWIRARGEDAAIFTHGGVIAAIMEDLFPGQRESRYQWQPKNGLGYTLTFSDGKPQFTEIR